jgi:hypothetical protein
MLSEVYANRCDLGADIFDHCKRRPPKETPNNTSAADGIGGCAIIFDVGAAENSLRQSKTGVVLGLSGGVFGSSQSPGVIRHGLGRAGFS